MSDPDDDRGRPADKVSRYEEGETLRPDKLLAIDEPWTEVDSLTYGVKVDGHYVTAEVTELEVTDVRSVDDVAEEVGGEQ